MKKIIKLAFVAAFVAVAGYGVFVSQTPKNVSNLLLDNIEALAGSEGDPDFNNCRWADRNYWFCTPLGDGLACPCFM